MQLIKEVLLYVKKHPVLIIILFIGWLVNLSFFFPIKGNIGHDVYWHLALIEVAFKTFPFQTPIFAGEPLQGYNYLTDFFMFLITKLGISSLYVYFIIIPLFYVIFLSILVIHFGIRQNKSIFYVAPLTFFVFLATSFSYFLSLYKRGTIFFGFNYPTATQSSTTLTNFSYALTILIFFLVLIIFQKKKRTLSQSLFLGFLIGLAFGFKFYGGVILLILIGVHEFLLFIQQKDLRNFIFVILSTLFFVGLSAVSFYDLFNPAKIKGVFAFSPLAIPHSLIEDPDGLYIPSFVMARYTLLEAKKWFSPRLLMIEIITLMIYLVYNFGTRIIGFFYIAKQIIQKKITRFELTLGITIIISVILSITLVQRGVDWWNVVQFFGYGLFLANFFAASMMYKILRNYKEVGFIIAAIIILLTMPLNIELIMKALERVHKPYDISIEEQNALAFLKKRKDNGVVFALPVFADMAYVPARSAKPVFFADEFVISNLGIDYAKRKEQLKNLKDLNIEMLPVRYFYLVKSDKDFEILLDKIRNSAKLKRIYENSEVVILEK